MHTEKNNNMLVSNLYKLLVDNGYECVLVDNLCSPVVMVIVNEFTVYFIYNISIGWWSMYMEVTKDKKAYMPFGVGQNFKNTIIDYVKKMTDEIRVSFLKGDSICKDMFLCLETLHTLASLFDEFSRKHEQAVY